MVNIPRSCRISLQRVELGLIRPRIGRLHSRLKGVEPQAARVDTSHRIVTVLGFTLADLLLVGHYGDRDTDQGIPVKTF